MCVCKPLKDHAVAAMRNSKNISTVKFSLSFDAAMAVMSGQYCGLTAGRSWVQSHHLGQAFLCVCVEFACSSNVWVSSLWISRLPSTVQRHAVSGSRSECESE